MRSREEIMVAIGRAADRIIAERGLEFDDNQRQGAIDALIVEINDFYGKKPKGRSRRWYKRSTIGTNDRKKQIRGYAFSDFLRIVEDEGIPVDSYVRQELYD